MAVLMEGNDLVEGMALGEFPVDGADATGFLAEWIKTMRWEAAVQAVVLGGITLAGLVDLEDLAERLGIPVLAATRRETAKSRIGEALTAAGLADRLPFALPFSCGDPRSPGPLYGVCGNRAGSMPTALIEATLQKSRMPEPLRLAHSIASSRSVASRAAAS